MLLKPANVLAVVFGLTAVCAWALLTGNTLGDSSAIPGSVIVALVAIGLALFMLARVALHIRGILGGILLVQAGYFAIGYLARPLVLLWVEPVPQPGDPIADVRLAAGGYDGPLADILPVVAIGLAVYVLALKVGLRRWPASNGPSDTMVRPFHAWILIVAGWAFRLVAYQGNQGSVIETGTLLAPLGVGAVLLFAPQRPRNVHLAFLVASELAWSAMDASKTPIMAVALWLLIRHFRVGGRLSPRLMILGGVGAFAAFQAITAVKVRSGTLSSTDLIELQYPMAVRPLFSLLTRFDALQSSTDAHFAAIGSWLTPLQAVQQGFLSLVPTPLLGTKADLVGVSWGTVVRVQSLPGEPGASLAQGPMAEGWVLGGYVGVVVEVILMAGLTLLVARWLRSQGIFWVLLGVAMTTQPFIFERAVLGSLEGLGKALQLALVGGLVLAVLRAADRISPGASGSAATSRGAGSLPRRDEIDEMIR